VVMKMLEMDGVGRCSHMTPPRPGGASNGLLKWMISKL
jgi:hypothetical protein